MKGMGVGWFVTLSSEFCSHLLLTSNYLPFRGLNSLFSPSPDQSMVSKVLAWKPGFLQEVELRIFKVNQSWYK